MIRRFCLCVALLGPSAVLAQPLAERIEQPGSAFRSYRVEDFEVYSDRLMILARAQESSGANRVLLQSRVEGTGSFTTVANVGDFGDIPLEFVPVRSGDTNYLLFPWADADGPGLWRTQGTTGSTREIFPLVAPREFTPFRGKVLFASPSATGGSGDALYEASGSISGTDALNFFPDSATVQVIHPYRSNRVLLVVRSAAVFGGTDAIWRLDDTASTARFVEDLPGNVVSDLGNSNGFAWFLLRDTGGDLELWRSDGTSNNTSRFVGVSGDSQTALVERGGLLYFTTRTTSSSPRARLFRSNGTLEGTIEVPLPTASTISLPDYPTPFGANGILYFAARTSERGFEFWRTNSNGTGTIALPDFGAGSNSGARTELDEDELRAGEMLQFDSEGGILLMGGASGDRGLRVLSDPNGTIRLVKDFDSDSSPARIDDLFASSRHVYFTRPVNATAPATRDELWAISLPRLTLAPAVVNQTTATLTGSNWWYAQTQNLTQGAFIRDEFSAFTYGFSFPTASTGWYGVFIYDGATGGSDWGFFYRDEP